MATGKPRASALLLMLCVPPMMSCVPDSGSATAEEWRSPIPFDSSWVSVVTDTDTVHIGVELAESEEQRAYGLMNRPELAQDRGMIFTYPELQDPDRGFWMLRTRMPLDIAFFDDGGRVVAVLEMEPCESPNPEWCPSYAPGVPYRGALEVNRGFLAANLIGEGARVLIADDPHRAR